MIFSNFITGARPAAGPEPRQASQQQQQQQQAAAVLGLLDGATAAGKARRPRQVPSKQLAINGNANRTNAKQISDSLNIHSSSSSSNDQVRGTTSHREEAPGAGQQWQLARKYTLNEVQQHSTLDDCWMVIFDKVYNITEFVDEHPGGEFILLEYAGRDATHPFLSSRHGSSAYKMLDKYWIGILVDEELYYSNNSSYCSVYSNLSWRSTPTLEHSEPTEVVEFTTTTTTTTTATSTFDLGNYEQTNTLSAASSNIGDEDEEDNFEDADDHTEEEEEEEEERDSNNDDDDDDDDDEDQGLGKALNGSQQACRTCSARSHSSRATQSHLGRR